MSLEPIAVWLSRIQDAPLVVDSGALNALETAAKARVFSFRALTHRR